MVTLHATPLFVVGHEPLTISKMWASGYELYDRLSPHMQKFLEGLTATHDAKFFHDEAERLGNPLRSGFRGSPLNQGTSLEAVHPVIRTNRPSPTVDHFVEATNL